MPRVNRDLQRRLAARRERDRRRPTERRYNFAPAGGQSEAVEDDLVDTEALQAEAEVAATPPAELGARSTTTVAPTRGGVRESPRPFTAYGDEYAYVYKDLRRVAVVIGGLLLALLVLYFVLPLLVR